MGLFVFALSAIMFLLLTSGGYVFFAACLRRKENPWLDEVALQKTSAGKYFKYIQAADKWLAEQNAEDVYTTSEDGLRLHGLWVWNPQARGTVILVHGYRSTYLLDLSAALPYYYSLGLNILIPEHRSHGKSEGRYITFGVKESKDMVKWLEYHNKQMGDIPVLFGGVSMGASTIMYLADKELPDNVKGIVADCGFTSPAEIISEVFRGVVHLPAAPSVFFADIFARLFAGFSLFECDSRKILANSRLPILLFHGDKDGFVPCRMSRDGHSACCDPKELHIIEGADHGLCFITDTNRYKTAVANFVEKYMFDNGEIL